MMDLGEFGSSLAATILAIVAERMTLQNQRSLSCRCQHLVVLPIIHFHLKMVFEKHLTAAKSFPFLKCLLLTRNHLTFKKLFLAFLVVAMSSIIPAPQLLPN
jgi:hypothetical protein